MADPSAFPDKFSLRINHFRTEQRCNYIDDSGTAKTNRLRSLISDNMVRRFHRLRIDRTFFNRTVGRTHTAADIAALKGRSGRAGTAYHKVRVSKCKLAIGTKVNKKTHLRPVPDHADQRAGSNISAHIASDIRCQNDMGVRMNCKIDIRCKQ